MKSPRILQMMLSTQEGGAENFFEKLALGFDSHGYTQSLIIEPIPTRIERLSKAQNAALTPIRCGGLQRIFAHRKIREAISTFQPDVILTWMNRASRRVPKNLSCPVIGRLGGYYKIKHYQNCTHLVGITPDLVTHIQKSGWPSEKSSFIPNFGETPNSISNPDVARAEIRNQLSISPDACVLLALGRLHAVKAHDTLFKAMAATQNTELLLAGEGPLRTELEQLASTLGISKRVHFLGWRRDVENLFTAADISVFPSRYEPNGTVVMESWAHRIPLIASQAKGPEWLVEDGTNGLLFPIDDIQALTASIEKVRNSPELTNHLITNGHRTFESQFSQKVIIDSYLNLFAKLSA